jgi:hypothetical protein
VSREVRTETTASPKMGVGAQTEQIVAAAVPLKAAFPFFRLPRELRDLVPSNSTAFAIGRGLTWPRSTTMLFG